MGAINFFRKATGRNIFQEAIAKEKQRVEKEKEKQQLIVKQSKTAQAGQERRKTIFAGGLGNAGNIFKKTLG
jgi:hypothetical protein